jgi:hypothetical protein
VEYQMGRSNMSSLEQKEEKRYLSTVVECVSKEFTDVSLETLSKAFKIFSKNIKVDEIGLLRKGEVMLRRIFI